MGRTARKVSEYRKGHAKSPTSKNKEEDEPERERFYSAEWGGASPSTQHDSFIAETIARNQPLIYQESTSPYSPSI
jgi:hypothetical protein